MVEFSNISGSGIEILQHSWLWWWSFTTFLVLVLEFYNIPGSGHGGGVLKHFSLWWWSFTTVLAMVLEFYNISSSGAGVLQHFLPASEVLQHL